MRLRDEGGGVIAKVLGLLVVVTLLGGAGLYLYAKQQRPLSFDGVHVATNGHERDPASVAVTPNAQIFVATIVHNDGRLPVTVQGLSDDVTIKDAPFVPVSIALGDGKTPEPASTGFAPPSLDPGDGIGIVITFQVNPSLPCNRFTDAPSGPLDLPPVAIRFTSYGVETTQSITLGKGAPTIDGLTRARCEAASR